MKGTTVNTNLFIEATELTPRVLFNLSEGEFAITGKSLPESGEQFYQPILDWLDNSLNATADKVKMHIALDQMNISSSKMILFILYKLKNLKEAGKSVSVWWYHAEEDSDMLEVGEDYEFMVDLPFRFKTGKIENSELLVA
jgi:hypothetical protein